MIALLSYDFRYARTRVIATGWAHYPDMLIDKRKVKGREVLNNVYYSAGSLAEVSDAEEKMGTVKQ